MSKTILLALIFSFAVLAFSQGTNENDRPIIAVIGPASDFPSAYPSSTYSYIKASYVKWVESGGARVTPIAWAIDAGDILNILSKCNGVVIAGGYSGVSSSAGDTPYEATIRQIVNYVVSQNNAGTYYPLFAIDQGADVVAAIVAEDNTILSTLNMQQTLGTLALTTQAYTGKMYQLFPSFLSSYLQSNAVFWFNSTYGITPTNWNNNQNLSNYFNILSTTFDNNGLEFVSSFEGKNLPLYGVQFNPEKAAYEWDTITYNHEYKAIQASQLLINGFIDESRNNFNVYATPLVEDGCLIYNWNTTMLSDYYCPMYFLQNSAGTCLPAAKSVKKGH